MKCLSISRLDACRRIPNSVLDQRMMAPKRFKSLANVQSPWLWPAPVINCTVWWGRLGSRSPALSDHTLTVVTELPMEGAPSTHPKEMCIEQYGCALPDKPLCKCKDASTRKRIPDLAALRTTAVPSVAISGDFEQQESILQDIQEGIGSSLGNMHSLGVQLPQQRISRRYFNCDGRLPWPHPSGCGFVSFFD